MSINDLSNLMNSLNIQNRTPIRDQEPISDIDILLKNTNIASNFFNVQHSIDVIKKFISTNVIVFRIYLGLEMFNRDYEACDSAEFLQSLNYYKTGLTFFVTNYNENNVEYNYEFVKNFNTDLHKFIVYNVYETGYLL
tara:strand:- start:17 stop:430 length:414 start_codon:yes stop_codon:yes gene_type:complete